MLSDEQIDKMLWDAQNDTSDRMAYQVFARLIEAEVRKQDDALIQQLVEALESLMYWGNEKPEYAEARTAITAARKRQEGTDGLKT